MPTQLAFEPPGPGLWTLDTAHFPRPATRYVTELFADPARRGFQEATARYGLLLDHIAWRFVHRWAYLRPRPVQALEDAGPEVDRQGWEALVRSTPALGERLARSERVFEDRPWREDVRIWDHETKPAMRRRHLALQHAAPREPDARGLTAHLERARVNLARSIFEHHRLNVAPVIPAGDFLAHATQWTGRPPAELAGLLTGDGQSPPGAAPELARLVTALEHDPAGGAALAADDTPARVLAALAARPPPVGPAAVGYLDLVGHWSVGAGSDVGEPCLAEMPHLLVEHIRAATAPRRPHPGSDAGAVRADVPSDRRADFDRLLAEAKATHRVRDERATFCDVWAYGLCRRAILAAGAHLAGAGALERPEHLVEAGHDEMRSLLEGGAVPAGEELAARARERAAGTADHVPVLLGGPPRSPVPVEWLPAGAARTERAFRTYLAAMSEEAQAPAGSADVRGLAASPGTHEGRARVVRSAAELDHVEPGDVLVTGSTTPAFNAVLPLVGAIVTDRGGVLSHAAIMAREHAIPAVVGTRDASATIPDGATVVVDGRAGEVRIVSSC